MTGDKKDVNIELTPEDPIRAKKRKPDVRTSGRRFSGGNFGGGNRSGSGSSAVIVDAAIAAVVVMAAADAAAVLAEAAQAATTVTAMVASLEQKDAVNHAVHVHRQTNK